MPEEGANGQQPSDGQTVQNNAGLSPVDIATNKIAIQESDKMAQTIPAKNLSSKIQDVNNSKVQSQGGLINDANKYESTDKITINLQEVDKGIDKAANQSNDGVTTNTAGAAQNVQAPREQQQVDIKTQGTIISQTSQKVEPAISQENGKVQASGEGQR